MTKHAGTVVLEVGLTERAEKAQNPNVPYGPDEVAADLVACMSHGATLVHYHARYDDGRQGWNDPELSRPRARHRGSFRDLFVPELRRGIFSHVFDLADRPGAASPPDLAVRPSPTWRRRFLRRRRRDETAGQAASGWTSCHGEGSSRRGRVQHR